MFKKTVDSVISDINVKINALRGLAEDHHNLAQGHLNEAAKHEDVAAEHALDRDRATRIASKFEELLK